METKVCSKCKVEKQILYFTLNSKCKLGVSGRCKSCTNIATKEWRDKNKTASKLHHLRYRIKSKSKIAARNKRNFNLLTDGSVANALGMKIRYTPLELLELKREQLKMYRLTKQLISTCKEQQK